MFETVFVVEKIRISVMVCIVIVFFIFFLSREDSLLFGLDLGVLFTTPNVSQI